MHVVLKDEQRLVGVKCGVRNPSSGTYCQGYDPARARIVMFREQDIRTRSMPRWALALTAGAATGLAGFLLGRK